MADVRTTLTLEPDVYSLIQARLETPGATLKGVVNEAIRAGLAPRRRATFQTRTHAMGRPAVDLDHALRLAGELDDDALRQRLEVDG